MILSKKNFVLFENSLLFNNYRIVLSVVLYTGYFYDRDEFEEPESNVPKVFRTTLPATFIIDTNTTHYLKYNATTMQLEDSGTDCRVIIQEAMNETHDVGGGVVYIKNGFYTPETYNNFGQSDTIIF